MSLIDIDAQMRYDQAIMKFMVHVMSIADQRRHFGDDEYLPPLPIHGSARWHDRQPIARPFKTSMNLESRREMHNIAIPGTNNEEGA